VSRFGYGPWWSKEWGNAWHRSTVARRAQLLEAALHCLMVKGFHQSSMRDIAAQAGLSLANLYNHFENKSALVAEIAQME